MGDYVPTIFDNFTAGVEVDKQIINFSIWDTAGQEEYARLRALSYPETDVFLLCYSISSATSFDNIKSQWDPEVSHHCTDAKKILVGTKIDLRSCKETLASAQKIHTVADGKALANDIGAECYLECSALTQEGLKSF